MALINSQDTKRLEIPHEPGQWMEFRRLRRHELEEARRVSLRETMARAAELPAAVIESARQARLQQDSPPVEPSPRAAYDDDTLIKYGLVAWSYDAPCDDAYKADLDDETAEWAAQSIFEMNVRSPGEGVASALSSSQDGSLQS